MDRYTFGLIRAYNYYRINDVLANLSGTFVCPVCLTTTCEHGFDKIDVKNATELLKWWRDVTLLETKELDYLFVDGEDGNYIYPKLIEREGNHEYYRVVSIPKDAVLGTIFNNTFYDLDGGLSHCNSKYDIAYGYCLNDVFTAFALFKKGYIIDIEMPYIPDSRQIWLTSNTVPCYNFGMTKL